MESTLILIVLSIIVALFASQLFSQKKESKDRVKSLEDDVKQLKSDLNDVKKKDASVTVKLDKLDSFKQSTNNSMEELKRNLIKVENSVADVKKVAHGIQQGFEEQKVQRKEFLAECRTIIKDSMEVVRNEIGHLKESVSELKAEKKY